MTSSSYLWVVGLGLNTDISINYLYMAAVSGFSNSVSKYKAAGVRLR
jgi:hypothetical protein